MSTLKQLRLRQIHLDFHTAGMVENIGGEFDPAEFAQTLVDAGVDSITCFARCHHGYLYYPSKLMPQRIHPNLKRPNLLGEQIEACHKAGIRVPIYITVQWDQLLAEQHPEWRVIEESGKPEGTPPYHAGFYRRFCLNSGKSGVIEDKSSTRCNNSVPLPSMIKFKRSTKGSCEIVPSISRTEASVSSSPENAMA